MANVLRAPVYVPRPAEEAFWQGKPTSSAAIRMLTQQKMYGAGGQVPTKRYRFDYMIEEPVWVGEPEPSAAITLLTQQKVYGAGGQVPTKRYRFDYMIDEPLWLGEPEPSAAISLLTQQKIYGKGGQVPTREWRWDFNTGETFWTGEPEPSAAISLLTQQKVYGQGGQVPTKRYRFDTFDEPFWLGSPENAAALNLPVPSTAISRATFYVPRPSEETFWTGQGNRSDAISLLTVGGQLPTKQYTFTIDDPPTWQWHIVGNPDLFKPALNPFIPVRWAFNYVADPDWVGSPTQSGAITATRTQIKIYGQPGQAPTARYTFTLDDPPAWQWRIVTADLNILKGTTPFFAPPNVWINYDSLPPIWVGEPIGRNFNVLIPVVPVTGHSEWIIRARRRGRR